MAQQSPVTAIIDHGDSSSYSCVSTHDSLFWGWQKFSVITTYWMDLSLKTPQRAASSSQTTISHPGPGPDSNSEHTAILAPCGNIFPFAAKLKNSRLLLLLEAVAPWKPQDFYKRSSWWETGSHNLLCCTSVFFLSRVRDAHANNTTAAWEREADALLVALKAPLCS